MSNSIQLFPADELQPSVSRYMIDLGNGERDEFIIESHGDDEPCFGMGWLPAEIIDLIREALGRSGANAPDESADQFKLTTTEFSVDLGFGYTDTFIIECDGISQSFSFVQGWLPAEVIELIRAALNRQKRLHGDRGAIEFKTRVNDESPVHR
jgi:hypothetical protein